MTSLKRYPKNKDKPVDSFLQKRLHNATISGPCTVFRVNAKMLSLIRGDIFYALPPEIKNKPIKPFSRKDDAPPQNPILPPSALG